MDLSSKYPESGFQHWLAMFSINKQDWTTENITAQIHLYKQIEGEEEFRQLQHEIKEIIQNKDLIHFLFFARERNNKRTLADLERMTLILLQSK